ncbi:MAG: Two component transcriptional regulator [Candidatus Magnetoglobus multicellularis str. Araruama]|uniref:histidine kinase n=1 Tax=Candidatus Magnetoglobus multicellularis str. Araruama TaxID=890399 RepID=A0A1V1PCF9_9BACT|nr:MAG: Two component transcriptional regulator [Candidatus Magnetoglobus multicellularis str. Araruama]
MNSQAIATDLFDALDEASQSIFYVIQDGVFVYGNKIGCRITGLNSLKDVLGKPALTFVHPDDKEMLTRKSRKVMQGKRVQPFEWRLHTVDGSIVWVLGLLVKIHFKGRPALLGNYIDITQFKETRLELKRTSERLEDLAIDIHSIREEERAQIAWEIQENLGHSLESLKIEIIALLKDDSPKQQDKEKLLHKIDSSLDTIKRISVHLKPKDIDRNEFISVIREYAVEFEDKTGIVLKVKAPRNFKNLDKTQVLIFFQAYQIMLNTLFNLGRFTKIDITVQQDNHQLELRLSVNIKEFKKRLNIVSLTVLLILCPQK